MSKYADRYFQVDPWRIEEIGFVAAYGLVSESIFSLGNEYAGLRGYFEEGYSGERLQGAYINGVYEQRPAPPSGYKGITPVIEFMVNSVDWVYAPIVCNGVALDLAKVTIRDFRRSLDLKTGTLKRSFIWEVDANTSVSLSFERFLSMENGALMGQEIHIKCLSGSALMEVTSGLDFSNPHESCGDNFWVCSHQGSGDGLTEITGTTVTTKQQVRAMAKVDFRGPEGQVSSWCEAKQVGLSKTCRLEPGQDLTMTKVVHLSRDKDQKGFAIARQEVVALLEETYYDSLHQASIDWWDKQWATSDIQIEGDPLNQQGIRFCIFQLHQTLHDGTESAVIGAKGLTGEAYNGNTFWDSEVYCLPFYLFSNPSAAKSILKLRYDTLDKARERAKALDCQGAFYPIATISGYECCDLWQHASLQLQASTGVAYGLWHYEHVTKDKAFVYAYGCEMLIEISRMLATRGDFNQETGAYGYYGVMGPDEFQMMVHNNTYTNYLAKKTLDYTIQSLKDMAQASPEAYEALQDKVCLKPEEIEDWAYKSDHMCLLYDETSKLYEQHSGFYDLPHLDIHEIPVEDFPLYAHWSYERIYRNNMLKQPDVLMFMLMYNSDFSLEALEANYDYYEPKCIHESSLSPSVHSILAAQLGREAEASKFFDFATRMDLDNYNRNTGEGLHTTSIAGSWMNIVYGFGGLRSDGQVLTLNPMIPSHWIRYTFHLLVDGVTLQVTVDHEKTRLETKGGSLLISIAGKDHTIGLEPTIIESNR